jgi:signal transduction histidine kinase
MRDTHSDAENHHTGTGSPPGPFFGQAETEPMGKTGVSRIGEGKGWLITFSLLAFMVLVFTADAFADRQAATQRVLILHSYYQGYKWTDDEHAGIESVLKPVIGRNNLHIEYMDTKKIFGDLYSQRLYEVYKVKYRNYKFDLIIATDNNAYDFMRKYRDSLFPGTPVVFCGVNYFEETQLKGHALFTGVNEENDLKGSIELILKYHPNAKQIVFINEWTTTGQRVHEGFVKALSDFSGHPLQFRALEDVTIEEIVESLEALPKDSVVLYTAFSRDRSGKLFDPEDVISLISRHCKVPIYTTNDFNIGHGVVGGLVVRGYDQGEAAGLMALRILRGIPVQDIPVMTTSPKRYMFDYAQMQKFKIPIGNLPEESMVVNLPQTFYFKYKKWVDALILAFLVLLSIISGLLLNIRKRRKTEKDLEESREQLRTLAGQLAESEETARKRLSTELHDQVGQNLTLLGVNISLLRSLAAKGDMDLINARVDDSLSVVVQTSERIRHLMNDLRSPVLDDYGLVAAIDLYGRQCASRTGLNIIVRGIDTNPNLAPNVENGLFRIVQESITNVVKHARATQVIIGVVLQAGRLVLTVEDNGVGYDAENTPRKDGTRGWGLVNMAERARAMGGACRVQSCPGMGTHVIVEVPV